MYMPAKNPSTQDFIVIETVEGGTAFFKDGGLRQVVMVSGFNIDLMAEEEQEGILNAYQNFLNTLDFPTQIVIHSRKFNIENYLKNIAELEKTEANELLRNQIAEYKEFIKSFVEENDIMTKIFLVVVPFEPISLLPQAGFFSRLIGRKKTKEAEKALAENRQMNIKQLKQRTDQVISGIQAIGLRAVPLNDEELMELYYNFYNPETVEKEK